MDAPPAYESTVVARQGPPPSASATRLSSETIAEAPLRTAEDALRSVPGLTLVQHGSEGKGYQFFLRGFDAIHGSDLELRVEGIPVNEWSNVHAQGYVDLGFVIPEAIQAIEVVKGPFTWEQGAFAMAGSANYELGIPAEERGLRVAYTAGTTNRHRGVLTYGDEAGERFVAVEALHDDGFGQNRDIDKGAVLGKVSLLRTGSSEVSLVGGGHLSRFGIPGILRDEEIRKGEVRFLDAYDRAAGGSSSRGLAALRMRWGDGPDQVDALLHGGLRRLELLENYTGFLLDPSRGDRRLQHHESRLLGAKLRYERRLHPRVRLTLGVGAGVEWLSQLQAHVDQGERQVATERALEATQGHGHALVGVVWAPAEALQLSAGVRVDGVAVEAREERGGREGAGAEVAISPRLQGALRVTDGLQLFGAYGRGFRPPEALAFTGHEPDRAGRSQPGLGQGPAMTTSDAFELGLRMRQGPVRAAASGFATFVADENVFDHVSGLNLDLGATRRLGVELDVEVLALSWLRLGADVTYTDARFVSSGDPIPLAPSLVGSARAALHHPSGLRSGLRLLALAPRDLPYGARGAPLTSLDATAGYQLGALGLDLEVENLLGLDLREGEYHYASHSHPGGNPSQLPAIHTAAGTPRTARITASWRF